MKLAIFTFLLLFTNLVQAERLDGPANIRVKPNGGLMASLADNLTIYPLSRHGEWYKVHLLVSVKNSDYLIESNKVIKNATLHEPYRNMPIGRTLNQIHAPLSRLYSEDGKGEYLVVVLEGYTHKNNLKEQELLEEGLARLLGTSAPVTIDNLKSHLQLYRYGKYWGKHDDFSGYTYNGDLVYDPSPTVRIILFLCNDELCAIAHQRPIDIPSWKDMKSHRGLTLTLLNNFPKPKYNEFLNWYNRSFAWYD